MRTVDCRYTISDERLRAYARVPLLDRRRWLEELARFNVLWREAPHVGTTGEPASDSACDPG